MDMYMARARANLLQKDWDEARGTYVKHTTTMVLMKHKLLKGWRLLLTRQGMPSRSKTGRLLASLTSKPEALLLSGEFLQMDGRYPGSMGDLGAVI